MLLKIETSLLAEKYPVISSSKNFPDPSLSLMISGRDLQQSALSGSIFQDFPDKKQKKEQFSSRNIDCYHFLRQWLINSFHIEEERYREVVVCSIYGWNCSFRDDSCTTARWLHVFIMNCNFLSTGNIDYIVSYIFLILSHNS